MRLHQAKKSNISMLTATAPNFKGIYAPLEHYGRIVRDTNKKIVKIVEYKDASLGQRKIMEVNPNIYMFNTAWLWQHAAKIKNKNEQAEYYLTDIVEIAIAHSERIQNLPIEPKEVIGVNSPADLKAAEQLL
jgi:bifunctional N-acetylglucosamine-1-phosphate-uridyltransferase/glucosamine-1-phosphate-acetyltransferase GlmU-like protein